MDGAGLCELNPNRNQNEQGVANLQHGFVAVVHVFGTLQACNGPRHGAWSKMERINPFGIAFAFTGCAQRLLKFVSIT
jgi:hypothetical protein